MNLAPPTKPPHVGLKPPQFRLRSLLIAITALAVLIALAKWWSVPVIVGVVFLLISIALHIAGNALGMQLRKNRGRCPAPHVEPGAIPPPREIYPAAQLAVKRELGQPIRILTIAGGVLGAIGGVIFTWYQNGKLAGWENYLTAVVAFGVLGAFWSFLIVGFVQVIWLAAREAIRGHAGERSPAGKQDQNVV